MLYAKTLIVQAQTNTVLSGLSYPVALDFASGGRIFFDEKNTGNVRIVQGGILLPTPFATLSVSTAGPEQGLLGIRLDPNFSSNGFVYVYATVFDGTFYHGHITRFTAVGNLGTSPANIFDVTDPTPATTNHDGGYMKFGPDGKLYVQVGEFAVQNLSQNLTSNAGKILRMNSDGSVPVDNPFPGSLVYAYGFRNGFGMDFDPATGRLIGTEAGPDRNDKVEFIIKGGNYCWPLWYTGGSLSGCVGSILSFTPPVTPTGIAFASPNTVYFGEYNTAALKRLTLSRNGQARSVETILTAGSPFNGIFAVERGLDGLIYFTTTDTIYTLTPPTKIPVSNIAGDIINAPTRTIYVALPDYGGAPGHTPLGKCSVNGNNVVTALSTDIFASAYLLARFQNSQNEVLDTNSQYFGSTTGNCGQPTFNGATVVFASAFVSTAAAYYDLYGYAPVYLLPNATSQRFEIVELATGDVVASMSFAVFQAHNSDLFVIQAFTDSSGRAVYLFWGIGWRATFASTMYFVGSILPNVASFTKSWYVFQWVEGTGASANSFPDPGDSITLVGSG